MKVAIFSDTFFPQVNGVANVAYQSAAMLAELGHYVKVFVPGSPAIRKSMKNISAFGAAFLPSMPALVYPAERAASPFGISAYREFKKFDPDIMHSHTPFAVGWASVLAAKVSRAKLVGTHHTFYDHYLKHAKLDYSWGKKLSWKYTVRYYNHCDLVLSPTQSLADTLVHHGLTKPVKIFVNPIDMDFFSPVTVDEKRCLKNKFGFSGASLVYMGRLSYEKSIDKAIRAFSLALQRNPALTFMVIGDGPEKNTLENLCRMLRVRDRVIFTGFLRGKELVEAMQTNDLFITASKSENMPLSILESMAVGLPVVGVAEKGIVEIVHDGANGFLAPADNVEILAEKISQIFSNDALREKMGFASRVFAEQYSRKNVARLLEKVYEDVLMV